MSHFNRVILIMWVFACAIPTTAVADNLGIDSIESEVSAIPNIENAVNLYKRVKDVQFSGAEDDEYYPIVIDAFKEAYAVILEAESDSVIDQCKGILIDLNSTLARGAIYYSSNGKSSEMSEFAKAYVDTQLLPQMLGVEFRRDKDLYPALVYCAASGSYNSGDIDGAIKYFEEYLATGETKQREQVSLFYGQAILNKKLYSQGTEAIVNASNEYPSNYNLLTIALQLCIDGKRRDLLAPLVERALEIKPDDEKLLNLQASVYEDSHNYRGALDIYMRLQEKHPNSLSVNECVARCYYNLGTGYYNKSISELDQKELAKLRRQSNAYFSSAAEKYEELTANDPNNIKYLKAMATSYACLGNKSKVESINIRLAALGQPTMAMNTMPVIMGNGTTKVNETTGPRNIPSYQEYALEYVRTHLKDWMKRGEFEKAEDYERRISRDNMRQEQERLSSIIADKYLKTYANQLAISELKLQPYDVDNETYAVNSDFGTVVINVPLNNHEAELFKTNWDEIKIKNPKFFIKHDNIAIESITFITPDGKEYAYNAADRNQYESDKVVHVDISDLFDKPTKTPNNNAQKNGTTYVATIKSDVDKNIPQTSLVNDLTIALIIANENYNKVVPVSSANHDGEVFAQYCKETLGIPDNQVFLYKDATYGETLSAINKLRNSVKALGGNVDLIVYYAGHGVPDEKTSDAYMMPIDADPMVMATAYPLNQFYKELNSMGAANIMVFLDACFSGANRGDGMLAEARGVVLVSKQAPPEGNMFVLSAADGKETALPYKEKNHGLFTYFLLKKLQESNGNATLKEISDYVTHNVQKTSSLTLNKPQNPKLTVGGTLQNAISKKKLRP